MKTTPKMKTTSKMKMMMKMNIKIRDKIYIYMWLASIPCGLPCPPLIFALQWLLHYTLGPSQNKLQEAVLTFLIPIESCVLSCHHFQKSFKIISTSFLSGSISMPGVPNMGGGWGGLYPMKWLSPPHQSLSPPIQKNLSPPPMDS